jgi:hypothetical protein
MKQNPNELQIFCWEIELTTKEVFRFTSHFEDITQGKKHFYSFFYNLICGDDR